MQRSCSLKNIKIIAYCADILAVSKFINSIRYGTIINNQKGGMYHEMAACQNCDRYFKRYFNEHINYCPTCGQRLDWGEE